MGILKIKNEKTSPLIFGKYRLVHADTKKNEVLDQFIKLKMIVQHNHFIFNDESFHEFMK
ncbi:MAG: hypothetical protein CM15mP22_7640 [Gammaproteobacteria bacterium]|nr:MAG: hypothetical protein CM15mP22_7640 [Gammaproteobacteria bacterium]